MEYESQMKAFAKFGLTAGERLVQDNAELFLSLDEKTTVEAVISVVRLRAVELPTPASEEDCYNVFASILGELLSTGAIKPKSYGLSNLGREEFSNLVNPPVQSSDPNDRFRDVIELYRGNVGEFNNRRASDADFLRRSNEANQLGILR